MKKFVALLCALVLTLCSFALAEGTYTHHFTAEELAGNTEMNGFVSASAMTELNTLVLKDDGTYEYTKKLGNLDENGEVQNFTYEGTEMTGACLIYTFTGSYTQDGENVTLNVPDDCVFSEAWGALTELGYMSDSEGVASEGARVVNYEGTDFDPMDCFAGPYYKFTGHDTPVNVVVAEDGTFSYAEVVNSDDE